MRKPQGAIAAIIVPAIFAMGIIALPAMAQEKKAEKAPVRAQKIFMNNDRVRVSESVFKPGEVNPVAKRGYRVTRVLKGSTTLVRTHADGKTEKLDVKEGDVYFSPADNASTKNVGKSAVTIYTVVLKPE